MNALIHIISQKPKSLLLIDAIGALVTATLLVAILAPFDTYFGMPPNVLYALACIAVIFAIYSFSAFTFADQDWGKFLLPISIANILYCCVTIVLIFYFYQDLTALGVLYFLGEIFIVLGLVYIELKVNFGQHN